MPEVVFQPARYWLHISLPAPKEATESICAMASFPLISCLLLLLSLPSNAAHHHHRRSHLSTVEHPHPLQPTTFFEVSRPIPTPHSPSCSSLLLSHDFGYTYNLPPITTPYLPPSHCPSLPPSYIVLEWSAACSGRQFDRIFGVWLGGVELLRSCTAEPHANGILWSIDKDVTRYSSLFSKPNTLAVHLSNIVDSTYTGVYHVNVSLHFYFSDNRPPPSEIPAFSSPADLILPISRPLPLNEGLWFPIENATDAQSTQLVIPSNAYRAVLEVYLSFHENDEFWYTNPPNVYNSANNLTDVPGNGPFREVTASIDGELVGAIWPFTVIYTGGINPLLWRPITAIGSFNLPSYDIEITPFLGWLLDGKPHAFGFSVTDALNVWYVDANLHLWLDPKSSHTSGKLIKYEAPKLDPSTNYHFTSLDGLFNTNASRRILATGWVKSSYGRITTRFFQKFNYKNEMEFAGNGSTQIVNQSIDFNYGRTAKNSSVVLYSEQVSQSFPLYVYEGTADKVNDTYSSVSNISLGFNVKKVAGQRSNFSYSSLKNSQNANGYTRVEGDSVTSGLGSTKQVYKYESTNGCYFRNVRSSNYTILHDKSRKTCTKGSKSSTHGSSRL